MIIIIDYYTQAKKLYFECLKELEKIKHDAIELGLPWSEVTDAGHTQIEPGTTTCISLGPAPEEKIDKITGELSLL